MRIGWTKPGKIFFSTDVKLDDGKTIVTTLQWEPGYAEGVIKALQMSLDGLKAYQLKEAAHDGTRINRSIPEIDRGDRIGGNTDSGGVG